MYLPSLTVPADVAVSALITSSGVNNLIKNAGGLVELVTILGNKAGVVDSASATITCTQNVTTAVFANRATAQTVQLPAWSGQRFPIFIEKSAANAAVITIQRAGSDTINNPFNSSASPVSTTFTLRIAGESCWLIPDPTTNFWHVLMVNQALAQLGCFVHSNANQTTVASGTIVALNTETYDRSNSWNNSTFRYTALVEGLFQFNIGSHLQLVTSGNAALVLRNFNVGNAQQLGLRVASLTELSTNALTLGGPSMIPMNVGDYANFIVNTSAGNVTIYGNAITSDGFTHASVACLGRSA